MDNKTEFTEQAHLRYKELQKEKEKIDTEIKPLKKYLEAIGVLKSQTKKRTIKQENKI